MTTPRSPVNRNLVALLVTVFLDFLGFGIVLPIIAPVLLDPAQGILPATCSHASRTVILGFLISVFPIAQFFGAPILGALSDRHGRKVILLASVAGTSVSLFLFGIGIALGSLPLLFGARLLNGLTGGNVSTAQSAIADMSDVKSKARNFGLIGMAFGLGFVLGPFFGGKLADSHTVSWFSFSTPYWFAGTLSVINVLLIKFIFRETLLGRTASSPVSLMAGFRNFRRAFRAPDLRKMFLVVLFLMFGFTFFTQFFQVYLIERFGFTQVQIGEMYAYVGIWIAFTQGVVTRLLSRIASPGSIVRISLLTLSAGLVLLLVPREPVLLLLCLPVVSLSQGVTMPNVTAMISNAVSVHDQGEILGINQSVQSVAFAVPPMIAGVVTSIDVRLPILLAATSTLVAWVVYMAAARHSFPINIPRSTP